MLIFLLKRFYKWYLYKVVGYNKAKFYKLSIWPYILFLILYLFPNATNAFSQNTIEGSKTVCIGNAYNYHYESFSSYDSLAWQVDGKATIIGKNNCSTVTVVFNDTGQFNVLLKVLVKSNERNYAYTVNTVTFTKTIQGKKQVLSNSTELYEVDYKEADYYEWFVKPQRAGSVIKGNGTDRATITWNSVSKAIGAKVVVEMHKCASQQWIGMKIMIEKAEELKTMPAVFKLLDSKKKHEKLCRQATVLCKKEKYDLHIDGDSLQNPQAFYECYIDNKKMFSGNQFAYNISLAPGVYFLKEIISVATTGQKKVITKYATIDLPPFPVVAFQLSDSEVCEGKPVFFANKSLHATSNIWAFGDGTGSTLYNAAKTYNFDALMGQAAVSLTVQNSVGCISEPVYKMVRILKNPYRGYLVCGSMSDSMICKQPITIQYLSMYGLRPDKYTWMNGRQQIENGNNDYLTVDHSGIYWVKTSNQVGCEQAVIAMPVIFTNPDVRCQ